jgi:hypothetical protein
MRKETFFLLMLAASLGYSQVGINTDDPQATLDINGTVKIREIIQTESISEEQTVLYIDNSIIGDAEVKKVTTQGLASVLYGSYVDNTLYGAKINSGLSLLSLSVFGNYQPILFNASDRTAGIASLFTSTTTESYYEVPSTGVYAIQYSFTYGTGIQLSLLGSSTGVGILKTSGGSTTVLDSKIFAGVNIVVAVNLTISTAELSGYYELNEGDRISFAVDRGGIALGLLGSSKASFTIRKISNIN